MEKIKCIYCGAYLIIEDSQQFNAWDNEDGTIDLEPINIKIGDYCCNPFEYSTPQTAYDRACGYFD